jgi:hypothetical protein
MTHEEAGSLGGQATKEKYCGIEVCSECGQLVPPFFSRIANKQPLADKAKGGRIGGRTTAEKYDMKAIGRLGGRPKSK